MTDKYLLAVLDALREAEGWPRLRVWRMYGEGDHHAVGIRSKCGEVWVPLLRVLDGLVGAAWPSQTAALREAHARLREVGRCLNWRPHADLLEEALEVALTEALAPLTYANPSYQDLGTAEGVYAQLATVLWHATVPEVTGTGAAGEE